MKIRDEIDSSAKLISRYCSSRNQALKINEWMNYIMHKEHIKYMVAKAGPILDINES